MVVWCVWCVWCHVFFFYFIKLQNTKHKYHTFKANFEFKKIYNSNIEIYFFFILINCFIKRYVCRDTMFHKFSYHQMSKLLLLSMRNNLTTTIRKLWNHIYVNTLALCQIQNTIQFPHRISIQVFNERNSMSIHIMTIILILKVRH